MSCQELPSQFIIKQDFISLRKTYSIHTSPSMTNSDMNNNTIFASKISNISKEPKIASYKTKIMTLRGMTGLPRIRMYFRPQGKASETRVATADAKGSFRFSSMKDMRYVFRCGKETYHIQEKKENILKNILKNELGFDAFKMNFEIYKQIVSNNNYKKMKKENNSLRKKLVAKVKVNKSVKFGKVTTKIKFFHPDDSPIKNIFIKRITSVRSVKSILRSKFFVSNNSSFNGYMLGLIAYIFANNEMKTLGKGASKVSKITSLLS